MNVNGESVVGYRANEGETSEVYGAGFAAGSLARVGARDRLRIEAGPYN